MRKTATFKKIIECLNYIKLPGIKDILEESIHLAEQEDMSYAKFLLHLLEHECVVRKNNKIQRLLNASKLPSDKSLDNFNMKRLPLKVRQKVSALLEGGFIDRKENILAFGQPGGGKTHLLCAIAREQVKNGRKAFFITCSILVQRLLSAKNALLLEKELKKLSRFDVILIDDIGYVQQSREEMEVLFTFLADRYEQGSLMISSNLPFSKWEDIFKDPMTTAAAVDRLVHHSIILEMNIISYRAEEALSKKKRNGK
jgi:DNA replication protein DnaC